MVACSTPVQPCDNIMDSTPELVHSQDSPSTLLLRFDSIRSTLTTTEDPENPPDLREAGAATRDTARGYRIPVTYKPRTAHIEVSPLRITKKQKIERDNGWSK